MNFSLACYNASKRRVDAGIEEFAQQAESRVQLATVSMAEYIHVRASPDSMIVRA